MWAVGVPGRRLEFSRTFPFSSPEFSQDLCSSELSQDVAARNSHKIFLARNFSLNFLDSAFPSIEKKAPDQGTFFQAGESKKSLLVRAKYFPRSAMGFQD
jgi:hypothetical protein